jgi:hypothetical protein
VYSEDEDEDSMDVVGKFFEGLLDEMRDSYHEPNETDYVSVDVDKEGVKRYTITIV